VGSSSLEKGNRGDWVASGDHVLNSSGKGWRLKRWTIGGKCGVGRGRDPRIQRGRVTLLDLRAKKIRGLDEYEEGARR